MKKLSGKYRDPLIFLSLLIIVPSSIYFISMNFGDQRIHIEKKQWNPAEAADQGVDPQRLERAAEYIETRLPLARGMVIIKNGKTIHEKYYWKGGPQEREYLHSLNSAILYGLIGIAIEKHLLVGPDQLLAEYFPDFSSEIEALTIGDLLRVKNPLIWGEGVPEYWDLFYAGDRIKASIKAISPVNGKSNPAINFAANFLLAEIIRSASSMSVFEFADKYLFTPMSIKITAKLKEKGSLVDPFIGFELRTLDLAKFGYMIMNKGVWEGSQVISVDWAAEITEKLHNGTLGGWQLEMVGSTESIMAAGEGGQYIVLAPERDLLIAVSSKSVFPLSDNNGYNHLFRLIFEASDEQLIARETKADSEGLTFYEPNFIYATEVPEEIRRFFHDLAKDIATQDINRILYHYAKGYENSGDDMGFLDKLFLKGDDYRSMYGYWKEIFYGGTGELEFVHIEKLRIDGNRAYLRGNLKYSYANMNKGSIGWFPLENLIRLRGRWLWFGSPDYGAILDRDEYFDAEISADLKEFIDECGTVLILASGKNSSACFAEDFLYNGLQPAQMQKLLKPLWFKDDNIKIHITSAAENGEKTLLEGYIENSLAGNVSLPPGMKITKQDKSWKWSGNGLQ
jgi:CubicO group peptidase (beta-lactamase class C family)